MYVAMYHVSHGATSSFSASNSMYLVRCTHLWYPPTCTSLYSLGTPRHCRDTHTHTLSLYVHAWHRTHGAGVFLTGGVLVYNVQFSQGAGLRCKDGKDVVRGRPGQASLEFIRRVMESLDAVVVWMG